MDTKELRIDPTGKFFKASEQLLYPIRSTPFPITKQLRSMGGGKIDVVKESANQSPTLVLVTSNRLMAHEMINSWRNPFAQEFPHLNVYEVKILLWRFAYTFPDRTRSTSGFMGLGSLD